MIYAEHPSPLSSTLWQFARSTVPLGACFANVVAEEEDVDERDELTEKIIAAAIEVHRVLGPGLLESIYEQALAVELDLHGISHQRQLEVNVVYKGSVLKGQRLDLLVAGEVIVETKSVAKLPDVAMSQVLSYLKATGLRRALILNFGCMRLVDGVERVSL